MRPLLPEAGCLDWIRQLGYFAQHSDNVSCRIARNLLMLVCFSFWNGRRRDGMELGTLRCNDPNWCGIIMIFPGWPLGIYMLCSWTKSICVPCILILFTLTHF